MDFEQTAFAVDRRAQRLMQRRQMLAADIHHGPVHLDDSADLLRLRCHESSLGSGSTLPGIRGARAQALATRIARVADHTGSRSHIRRTRLRPFAAIATRLLRAAPPTFASTV